MFWKIMVLSRPNGQWQARIDTTDGETVKVGELGDSQDAARGSLMRLYPSYFNIMGDAVLIVEDSCAGKTGY